MAAQYMPCPFPYFPIPYGCWCGITIPWPARHDPIDTFDEKCKIHDYCYEDAIHIEVSIIILININDNLKYIILKYCILIITSHMLCLLLLYIGSSIRRSLQVILEIFKLKKYNCPHQLGNKCSKETILNIWR